MLTTLAYCGSVILGVMLIGVSRWVADNFKIEGEHRGASASFIRMGGLYDDYPSRLYRWLVCVVTGMVFVVLGAAGLTGL